MARSIDEFLKLSKEFSAHSFHLYLVGGSVRDLLIKKEIDDQLYRIYTLNSFYHTPGSVTVIDGEEITREDKSLLDMVPRIR